MTQQPLISVIIPVYNVSAYLDECVNSVMGQTYQHLEIILVDDGSPDDCPQKCDDYAAKDSRIKVIHQKNGGLSAARNAALDICQGEYISFIDSDDAVAGDYIETLYTILHHYKAELSICNHADFSVNIPANSAQSYDTSIYSAKEAIAIILRGFPFTTSAWGKLYHRRLFQKLRYPEGMIYEDLATTWNAIYQTDKVVYANAVKYYYRQNPDSITQVCFSYKNMDMVKVHERLLDELPKVLPDLEHNVRERFGCYAAIQLYHALLCSFPDKDALRKLQQPIKQNLKPLLTSSFPFRIKLFGLLVSRNFIFNLFYRLRCRSAAA